MKATIEHDGQAIFLCLGSSRQYLSDVPTTTMDVLKDIILKGEEYSSRKELEDAIDDAIDASAEAEALYFNWEKV